jgi:hypothetical protein
VNGTVLGWGMPASGEEGALDLVAPIFAQSFLMCPICLAAKPSEREHVPQAALGGQAMTMTCPRCNSGLGSRIEAELHDWFDQALIDVSFNHEAVQGRRRGPRLLYREGSNGFCLIAEADVVPEIRQILNADAFWLGWAPHVACGLRPSGSVANSADSSR